MGGEGGEGGSEGGGFLGPWAGRIESFLNGNGHVMEGATTLEAANQASATMKVANAFRPFESIVGKPGMASLWTAGGEAAEHGAGFLGGAGKFLGPLGMGLVAAQGVGNGLLAANDISREGWDNGHGGGAYHDQEFYNHLGGTALSAAHVALPFMGPYGKIADLGLTAGEAVADYGGKGMAKAFGKDAGFSADGIAGGLIRGTFGDKSWGENVRQGVGNVFGHGKVANAVGWGADIATNAALLPGQLSATVGKGLWNEGSAIVHGIANGEGTVGHALNSAGKWAGHQASAIGGGISNAAHSALNWGSNAASNVGHGISNAASSAWNWGSNAASNVGHGLSSAASSVGSGLSHAASSVSNTASSAFHAVTSW